MDHIKILDCTLRDGAYLIDKKFGDKAINGIIEGLVKARIDFIEIGFLQDEGFGEGKTVFRNNADAARFVPKEKNGCQFTLLADYSRYTISNLDIKTDDGIDAVRMCFFKHERFKALESCKTILEKGYKLFVQPVDILGYSDQELIEFIEMLNRIEPYCLSIVDTFGSMYQEDLVRIFELIHHNLSPECKIGFHSHNNMQLSNALSQDFIRMSTGKRNVIVDGTISGMGRGAGNTPTELVVQYLVSKLNYTYNMDAILDTIDNYMNNIRSRCTWGYTTPYFIAGCYSAHVNNVSYLKNKNSIRSRDIRYILNKVGATERKRYNYDLLEKTYLELIHSDIDDSMSLKLLRKAFEDKTVLLIAPGNSVKTDIDKIRKFISDIDPVVIMINFIKNDIRADYIYMNNTKRYDYWVKDKAFLKTKKILTSNVIDPSILDNQNTYVVSFTKLVKCGWEHLDNSMIMILHLLDILDVNQIAIAGFDGFNPTEKNVFNYVDEFMELTESSMSPSELNREISEMLRDYIKTRKNDNTEIQFVTPSRFEKVFLE